MARSMNKDSWNVTVSQLTRLLPSDVPNKSIFLRLRAELFSYRGFVRNFQLKCFADLGMLAYRFPDSLTMQPGLDSNFQDFGCRA